MGKEKGKNAAGFKSNCHILLTSKPNSDGWGEGGKENRSSQKNVKDNEFDRCIRRYVAYTKL